MNPDTNPPGRVKDQVIDIPSDVLAFKNGHVVQSHVLLFQVQCATLKEVSNSGINGESTSPSKLILIIAYISTTYGQTASQDQCGIICNLFYTCKNRESNVFKQGYISSHKDGKTLSDKVFGGFHFVSPNLHKTNNSKKKFLVDYICVR